MYKEKQLQIPANHFFEFIIQQVPNNIYIYAIKLAHFFSKPIFYILK